MADAVTAYQGFRGRLYRTAKEADHSLGLGALDRLSEELADRLNYQRSVCVYTMPQALQHSMGELLALADKWREVYPDGQA